jgi:hypothetical protein
MLEPNNDYFVYVFLKVFNFNDSSLDSFRKENIKKRNIFCDKYNNNKDDCVNNACTKM